MQANDTSLTPGVVPASHVDVTINVHSGTAPTTEPSMMKIKMMSTSMVMNEMSTTEMMSMETTMRTTVMPSMSTMLFSPKYPSKARVLRSATAYARVVQPAGPEATAADVTASGQPALRFWLPDSTGKRPLDVTARGGIVYVSDAMALRSASDTVMIEVMWNRTSGSGGGGSAKIEIAIDNSSSSECLTTTKKIKDSQMKNNGTSNDAMKDKSLNMNNTKPTDMKNNSMKNNSMKNDPMTKDMMNKGSTEDMMTMENTDMPPSCASKATMRSCIEFCGLGTGATMGANSTTHGGCTWRGHKSNTSSPSQQYATCTPDVATCPDGVCDPLEDMHPGLCPQDCSMMESTSANATRGIVGGSGVCTCDATARCSCLPLNHPGQHSSTPMPMTSVAAAPLNEDCPNKGSNPSCGGLCQLFLILVSLLIIAAVIAILLWRYKKRHGSISCPSCPSCPPCPPLPCMCPPRCCRDCPCKNDALFSWLPKRLQRPPPPAVAPTPTSRVSSEFEQSGLQSVDAHLLPYGYMAPLGQLHPMHK